MTILPKPMSSTRNEELQLPFATVNGISLHYEETGQGVPILFIHPPLLTGRNFDYQKAGLSSILRVITFDIRGHGSSSVSKQAITYPIIVDDMIQLMNFLNLKQVHLCGYSTGGAIVLEALLNHPDRFSSGILVSGMSEMTDLYNRVRLTGAIGLSNPITKRLLAYGISKGNSDRSSTYQKLLKDAVKGSTSNMRDYYSYSKNYNCTDRLQEIMHPVLLVYGMKDWAFHRYAKILHERLPNNSLQFIEGVKHQIPTKAPAELNNLIGDWINKSHDNKL